MSIDNKIPDVAAEVVGGGSADPTGLPLFATTHAEAHTRVTVPGRVRGSFTMPDAGAGPAPEPPAEPAPGPVAAWRPGTLHPVPAVPATTGDELDRVSGWRASADLDWQVVASLRQQTAERLSRGSTGVGGPGVAARPGHGDHRRPAGR